MASLKEFQPCLQSSKCCQKANAEIQLVADASSPAGVLGNILEQDKFRKAVKKILDELNSSNAFEIKIEQHNKKDARTFNRKQFEESALTKLIAFRGYPLHCGKHKTVL